VIVDTLIGVLLGVLNAVMGLIPEFTIFEGPDDGSWGNEGGALDSLIGMLATWNLFFPVRLMFSCVLVIVGTKVFAALVQFLIFTWDKLPFKST
jgi:hypothetical protein